MADERPSIGKAELCHLGRARVPARREDVPEHMVYFCPPYYKTRTTSVTTDRGDAIPPLPSAALAAPEFEDSLPDVACGL
jgi:hypothetical protein